MARRLVSVIGRVKGGPARGGSTREIRIYDDEALTTLSTLYQRSAGGGTQPNGAGVGACMVPNSGKQVFLTADRGAGDAYVLVTDVSPFHVGDLIPIYDGTNTVYKVITVITPATKRLDIDQTLGFAFTAALTKVNNADMEGHLWFYLDDAIDKYGQVTELGSGRKLPPLNFPVRVPTASLNVQEEGVAVAAQGTMNFIGGVVTATNNGGAGRIDVTILAGPDNASYVTTAAEAGLSNEQVLGTAIHIEGVIGSRPAAALNGRLYTSTDETGGRRTYRDTGAAWNQIAHGIGQLITAGMFDDTAHGTRAVAAAHGFAQITGTITTAQHGALGALASAHALSDMTGVISDAQHGARTTASAHDYAQLTGYPALTKAQALLSSDVAMTNANTYYDAASVSLTAGTWLIISYTTILPATGVSNAPGPVTAKLWDGTTVFASGEGANYIGASGVAPPVIITLATIRVLGSTTTIKTSCAAVNASSTIKAAAVDNGAGSNASGIVALRIV